ncbi:phosphatidylinositol transfer protein 3-like [Macadamia integrifolia]|uniref:phosphatidylinositol transfer protein 3-like n=1 Tax=Macadamia integrifolia TaxID=60698 RepID=UPI001C52EE02|nr:phosphatidylinositol transfer protein 3-like [Macadamia integrifolia]XP_042476657.1 phosphatidylinositol transfer protein 3-like [Macadamia integrifolia]XP_042476658.1 phosphatidylinositol transfer protein 3-like [Macadamia integrifolia]
MSSMKLQRSGVEKTFSYEDQQAKINEVRQLMGPIADKLPNLCSDASILRYLRSRNWNAKKACKMLKETLKWRLDYKPEKICWEDVACEAETGKIYRTSYLDKYGRPVLVMRPGFQNTTSTRGQIKYLVYCMENAIMNLAPDQEEMVWLIDFQGWTMASISVKVTRETAHVLQNCYPERLGLAILYNPPKIFESFWMMVKPFLEPKTYKKVKFVYSNDPESQKIMQELFDMDKLESAFGGRNTVGFDYKEYGEKMKEDDRKMFDFINSGYSTRSVLSDFPQSELSVSGRGSDNEGSSGDDGIDPKDIDGSSDEKIPGQSACKDGALVLTEA